MRRILDQECRATHVLNLEAAVSEIKQAVDDSPVGERPFFVIVGAGVSVPVVPLASEIESECKQIAAKFNRVDEPPTKSVPIITYSHWFERAFPQAKQRQNYFRKLIENKPITHANLRLAHLIGEKRLATLVVTPNFDDFISRALHLFGNPHIVCDHPSTVERVNPESDDIQILHVHGTYWFYDGCNLRGEIEDRAEGPENQVVTMRSLVVEALRRHSPIVIGYAGWENDVIMSALKRFLASGPGRALGNNIYWFCFRRSDAEALPIWLREHANVRLVLPVQVASDPKMSPPTSSLGPQKPGTFPIDKDQTLPAQKVLDELVRAFGLSAPELTRDPIAFFARHLINSFPRDPLEKKGEDIYDLRGVMRRVESIRRSAQRQRPGSLDSKLERITDAVRRSAYKEALNLSLKLSPKLTTSRQRQMLMVSTLAAAKGLNDDSDLELMGYDLVLKLATGKVAEPSTAKLYAAEALLFKALTLSQLKRPEEEMRVYDELVQRFGDATEPTLLINVAKALMYKGLTLGDLNRSEQEIQTYDALIKKFGNSDDPDVLEHVARGMRSRGITFGQLNRPYDEIEAYDGLLKRFGDSTAPAVREQVAWGLFNKGVVLGDLKKYEDAIGTYEELVGRFESALEPSIREAVALALLNRAEMFAALERKDEALKAYGEVSLRFGEATEFALREPVATSLLERGNLLGSLNRNDEAIEAYNELLVRFAGSTEPVLREAVAKALRRKGLRLRKLHRIEEAISSFEEVQRRFRNATEEGLREQVAKALHNKADLLKQLGKIDEAKALLGEVLERFGDMEGTGMAHIISRVRTDLTAIP